MSPIVVTADPYQTQVVILGDGTSLRVTMRYLDSQRGWFIDELLYQGFILRTYRVTNSPNFLHQFCNIVPFGFACISAGNREPFLIDDFAQGRSTIYTLSADEVARYTSYLRNGN